MIDLKIEMMNQARVDEFCELSTNGQDEPLQANRDHIAWKHLPSPEGPSTGFNLYADRALIGRTLLQPRAFRTPDQILRGAVMMDLFIDPKYRGGPHFVQMMKAVEEASGFDFICHPSNQNSDQLFRSILGRKNPFNLSAFGTPLRFEWLEKLRIPKVLLNLLEPCAKKFLNASVSLLRSPNRPMLSDQPPDEKDFIQVQQAFAASAGSHFERSPAFLKWRFDLPPLWRGHCRHIYLNNRFCGYLGITDVQLLGGRFCVLSDIMLDPGLTDRVIRDIRLLIAQAALSEDFDAIFLMLNQRNSFSKRFLGYPFFSVPEWLLPHPVPLFMHAISPAAKALTQDPETYLTLADLDYF